MTHLKVAVRIRPLSEREISTNSVPVVEVQKGNVITITNLKVPEQNAGDSRERTKRFTFDYCFHPDSTQDEVFEIIGKEIEKAIQKRFHSCVLAYGQSSSGKTHTMMGNLECPGLTPSLCQNIFKYLEDFKNEDEQFKTKAEISYLEIYNEKVRDLLISDDGVPANSKVKSLRVREHPKKGPYVQGLTQRAVNDPENLLYWLKIGNTNRRVSATLTNPHSSRSHSVFTVTCGEGVQLHLIDLAGSERAGNKFHNISTLKEGANINKSLVALGNVISTLAEHSSKNSKDQRKRFVPYRDSILTWLLKDTLGGNSKTIMIATVSPSNTCYNETINTLRFGQRAKKIISHPVVNEDPKERTIRELRAEIARLKELLAQHQDSNFIIDSPSSSLNQDPNVITEIKLQEENNRKESCNLSDSTSVTSFNYKRSERLCAKSEKLWPVMNVKSEIDDKYKKQVPKIRRTFSVDTGKMDTKPKRLYGSHELISNNATKEKSTKRASQPSLLRKQSIDQPTRSLQKSVLTKRIQDGATKKSEAGVITEERGPKIDSSKKLHQSVKPRSQIVAAVTSRLYGKSKKKEVGTETEEIKISHDEVPRELTICSNARMRLRDLTQQALKAHRRKNIDTQTDLFPVLRVKEISTDSNDLKITLAEVKDAETDTIKIETKEAGIACCFIENFDDHLQDYKNAFVITRSCGTQSTENLLGEPSKARDQPQTSGISFTKYLQNNNINKEPTFQIINPCTANPIYTSSVNINVSHNYITRNHHHIPDAVSDDSLEEQDQPNNFCFPTPDIISNHNSLEHGNTNISHEQGRQEKHATTDATTEIYTTSENFIKTETPNLCVANFSFQTSIKERLEKVDFPTVYAAQICSTEPTEERCGPLWKTIPPYENIKPQIVTDNEPKYYAVVSEPVVLKSIMKHQETKLQEINKHNLEESISNSDNTFGELPDSLSFHEENNKKVHFSKNRKDNERILQAMSKFMEEATNLMTNLSLAANKLQKEQSFDLEVTVSDIRGLTDNPSTVSTKTSHDFQTQTCILEEASSQTSPKQSLDVASSTEPVFQIPLNKYEELVKESCDRLERCINKVEQQTCSKRIEQESLHKFPQPFSINSSVWNVVDDSSLESNITFSDYGSLPRQRQKRGPSCSPSAYLKQLTTMRKQIVESSRDDLVAQDKMHF